MLLLKNSESWVVKWVEGKEAPFEITWSHKAFIGRKNVNDDTFFNIYKNKDSDSSNNSKRKK